MCTIREQANRDDDDDVDECETRYVQGERGKKKPHGVPA